jgi:hypothetical protein
VEVGYNLKAWIIHLLVLSLCSIIGCEKQSEQRTANSESRKNEQHIPTAETLAWRDGLLRLSALTRSGGREGIFPELSKTLKVEMTEVRVLRDRALATNDSSSRNSDNFKKLLEAQGYK